ncbi:NfeD family protein [Fusobacterium sp. MFO224]|uniref:NfeD family protein n=1 Tax=Fusobacterium sp. MFO224 TaxID=3378070 RepID=UPI0038530F47
MIIWLVLFIVFSIIEIAFPALVSIWFAIAAMILTIIAGRINNLLYEFYIFIGLSLALLIFTKPLVKKLLKKRNPIENRIYGQKVKIMKVVNHDLYEVKLDGKHWKAICNEELKVGDYGIVREISGNKLILEKCKS